MDPPSRRPRVRGRRQSWTVNSDLTALNIAIYGRHAEKKKYAWPARNWASRYDLRFLTDEEAITRPGDPDKSASPRGR